MSHRPPLSSLKPTKSILRRSKEDEPDTPRLTWDEANLQLTEAQKNATMKVDEPKTPYIRYNPTTDQVVDMSKEFSDTAKRDPDEFQLDNPASKARTGDNECDENKK